MKRKVIRAITGLLCAAMVFSNVAGMSVYAMEDGGRQEMQESISGNDDTGEVWEEPEEAEQKSADSDAAPEEPAEPIDSNKEEDGQENREAEDEAAETVPEELEDPDETETVSENTVDEAPEEKEIFVRNLSLPQVYASGRSFTVDGKTYNSMDADETYVAGDDITAYYFAGDSLLYFDGTGPMKDWNLVVYRPWKDIKPEVCVIGEGITTVGVNAFYWPNHSLSRVTLPSTLREIGDEGFYQNYSMEAVVLPEGLEKIGDSAFLGCKAMKHINIPDSVTELGASAFYECKAITSIRVPGNIREIKKFTFSQCNAVESITIEEGVETIGDAAFQDTKIMTLSFPESLKTIGENAFNVSSDLNTLTIPDSVTQIGSTAFASCPRLHTISIGTGVTEIGEHAFRLSSEKKIMLHSENEVVLAYDWAADNRIISYRTSFFDQDGCLLQSGLVGKDEKLLDYAPQMESYSTGGETFTFVGWNPEITEDAVPTQDQEYRAVYRSESKKYSIRFLDYDGSVISELTLPYGADIYAVKPADPKRAPDERYTYQFSGWSPELAEDAAVTGDAEYTALYESAEREYSIRFLDYDGSLLSELALPYGADIYAVKPADPKRASDERHTYQFKGWSPSLTEDSTVTKNAEYTAVYTSAERLYVLSFVDHTGSTIKTVMEPYGTRIADKAPKNPTREPDGDCTYTFVGWQPALSEDDILTKDTEYQAVFTSSAAKCKVVFQDFDGSVLKELTLKAGETVSGEAPTVSREGDSLTTYTFAGWQPALDENVPIMGDITYKALYTRKTQTGVLAEHELNHPAGDGISAEDVRLYPVYEIYDTSDHFEERVTDRMHPVDASDIRLSKDRIEKGSNQIGVVQVSTGLRTEFRIFGNYIDGISVELAERKVKTGSRLKDLDVYFTKNRMGEDGQIKSGIVDKTKKVKHYIFADGAAYVTVRQGDNEIRITEQETGENHSCTVHITGVGKGEEKESDDKYPADDDRNPDGETEKEPSPEPDIWQIVLDIPKVEGKPADIRHYAVVWDNTGEEKGVLEAAEPFREILLQAEAAEESGETETLLPEIQEAEVQEQDVTVSEEQPVTGAEPEVKTEEPRKEKLPLWMLPAVAALFGIAALAVMFCRRRRQKFHGILTWEENSSIEISNPRECLETVQEVIDRTENLSDCMKKLRESDAKTCIPVSARMEVIYTDGDGETQVIESAASEKKMIRILSSLHESERAGVRIYHEQAGIDINLKYKL